jgi:TetR/AcrR family transcriptional regulator, transcriptional repressor of bet genes
MLCIMPGPAALHNRRCAKGSEGYDAIVPKVVDHDVRRAEVVAATWQVIADEGLEAATIRRIAQAAGCTTGRVTHYFDAKDDVLVAALEAVHAAAAERMRRRLEAEPREGEAALRAVLLEALPLDDERRREWGVWLAFWGRAAVDARLIREHERRYESWRALLGALVAQVSGARPGSAAVRTGVDLVATSIDGLGIQALLQPDRFPPRRLAAMVDVLVQAIGPGRPG